MCCSYHTNDADTYTLDNWLCKNQNNHSEYVFIKHIVAQFGKHQTLIINQAPSTRVVMAKVIQDIYGLYKKSLSSE